MKERFNFIMMWDLLEDYRISSKKLSELGISANGHDSKLYKIMELLLHELFTDEQVDFIIWSVFDDERELKIGEETVVIETADLAWEYVNKIQ